MGSSASKSRATTASESSSSSSSEVRRTRSKGGRLFQYSCLGSSDSHQVSDNHDKGCGVQDTGLSQVNTEGYRKGKPEQSDEFPCVASDGWLDETAQESLNDAVSRADRSSCHSLSKRPNPSGRFISRFGVCTRSVSFRLGRTTSLGSSGSHPLSSSSFTDSNNEEEFHSHAGAIGGLVNRNEARQGSSLLSAHLISRSTASHSKRSNPSGRFISRFGVCTGSVSFRLGRTTSLGSSGSHPSSSFTDSNNEEEFHSHAGAIGGLVNRNETRQGSSFLSAHLISRSTASHLEGTSHNRQLASPASGFSDVLGDDVAIPTGGIDHTASSYDIGIHSPRSHTEMESNDTRLAERRVVTREPVGRNFRFSRTLSVGRLRDRVGGRRQAGVGGEGTGSTSNDIALNASTSPSYAPSNMDRFVYNSEGSEVGTPQSREARYHDLFEHRLTFLERRRRIRAQVHALQRLGSRYENMYGHDRSCVLFGQRRTTVMRRCSCHRSTQNSNDDTSARASISRIVMLAEALFEVLDEIHQQSVVLSSRTPVSSIGSVPAPMEVVESLPVKLYTKVQKSLNEDDSQCYICLVEYEEGDDLRILPCCHEFHRVCIDKWLKEIHRVCPLCRGDVCRSESEI